MNNVIRYTHTFALILLSCILMCTTYAVKAQEQNTEMDQSGYKPDKIKDEMLVITLGADHCVQSIAPQFDNCAAAYPEDKNPCKGIKDCICSKKDKKITWKTSPSTTFEIKFTKSTTDKKDPFKNCTLKPESGSEISCKVTNKGSYTYDVYAKGCLAKPYDPMIIIR